MADRASRLSHLDAFGIACPLVFDSATPGSLRQRMIALIFACGGSEHDARGDKRPLVEAFRSLTREKAIPELEAHRSLLQRN